MNRIRVLNINYVNDPYGGVPVFLMNVFRHIDHKRIQFDFLTADCSSYYPYEQEIKKSGGKTYELHVDANSPMGKVCFGRKFYAFLKTHSYDIVHVNSGSVSFDFTSAIVAKLIGTKVIIHSHSTGGRSKWKDRIVFLLKLIMQKKADVLCACSKAAAESTFTCGKVNKGEVLILKNGIDIKRFQYNEETRKKIRKELNIEGRLVIGHVGRFVKEKNHDFLIDIFAEILRQEPSAVLLLVGQGELETTIREKIQKLHIDQNVIFCGGSSNVENFYQAMDIFLFPSIFEGLPISLIEAQANGLPCVISNAITTEVDITPLIYRMSLNESMKDWANKVLSIIENNIKRDLYEQNLKEAGYSIEDTALKISNIYENLK